MSPRAAWRLDRMGFAEVFDYEGGKSDWLAHALDYEGAADLVGRHLDPAPTCDVDEPLDEVRRRLGPAVDGCVVVADLLAVGLLDAGAAGRMAGDAMTFGVSTVRASEEASALRHRMAHRGVHRVVVTDVAGRLLGTFRGDAPVAPD